MRNLAISGAGTKGPALLGALSGLEVAGRLKGTRDVAGISFGAIAAVLWAAGMTFGDVARISDAIDVRSLFRVSLREMGTHLGLASTDPIIDVVSSRLPAALREATMREFLYATGKNVRIGATCLTDHRLVYFDAYSTPDVRVLDAVRASIAIPVAFHPCTIDGKMYVDGGAMRHVPYDPYVGYGADTMCVSIDTFSPARTPSTLLEVVTATFACTTAAGVRLPDEFTNRIRVSTRGSGIDFALSRERIAEMFREGEAAHARWETTPDENLHANATDIRRRRS